jgi:hypothetical protein
VIRTTDVLKGADLRRLPQIDLIVWDPTVLPPLFEQGDFALVHTQAARAIIEVKRSVPNVSRFQEQLNTQRMRLLSTYRRNVLGVAVAHSRPLFTHPLESDWVPNSPIQGPAAMTRLLSKKPPEPDTDGIFALLYFLSYVARFARNVA